MDNQRTTIADVLGSPPLPPVNNFDLIRLFAATQVMVNHAIGQLQVPLPPLYRLVTYFPGVPIFFFTSGLLVTASLSRRPLRSYASARARRVFPALWLAFAIAVAMLAALGALGRDEFANPRFWLWAVGQVSVLQNVGFGMFADFGSGVVNGALWTIPVELQFYIALPAIVWLAGRTPRPRAVLTAMMIAGVAISTTLLLTTIPAQLDAPPIEKLIRGTLIGHFSWFALGVLTFLNLKRLLAVAAWLRRWPLGWLAPIALYVGLMVAIPTIGYGRTYGIVGAVLLCAAVLSVAFAAPERARVLRGMDISYGIYLFHMLIVGSFVELGITGYAAFATVIVGSVILASLSWLFVESRALGRPAWIQESWRPPSIAAANVTKA